MTGGRPGEEPVAIAPRVHAPVWPGLRGVDLLRPALGVERDALRAYLGGLGAKWTEDPANSDPRYARVRVREAGVRLDAARAVRFQALRGAREVAFRAGWAEVPVGVPVGAPVGADAELLRLAAQCAAGVSLPRGAVFRGETLGGARRLRRGDMWWLTRDPGAVEGRAGVAALDPVALEPGVPVLWDARFEVVAHEPGCRVERLGARGKATGVPHALRRTLPGVFRGRELVAVPGDAELRFLGEERWRRTLRAMERSAAWT